jgi:hypothetical protein
MLDKVTQDLAADILNNIENQTAVILYIDKEGSVILLSYDEMTPIQKNILTRIMIAIGESSFIFKTFMFFEMLLSKLDFSIKNLFRRSKK